MKGKITGIIVLMLITTTVVSATHINVQNTIRTKGFEPVMSCTMKMIGYQPTLFDHGVDQQQTDNCGHGIILIPPWIYAQSFTPSKSTLTAVRLYLFKYGAPPDSVKITVAIRDNLTHADLATKTIDTSVVSIGSGTKAKWVLFDFDDITVTPGSKYYIVCSGSAGDSANTYCWFYNNQDTYNGGEALVKPDENSIWTNFTHGGFNPDDFCFKTYYLKPFGGSNLINNEQLANPWPIIESAPIKNEKRNEIDYSLSFFTPRLFCFGSINNLSVNGTTYFFKAVNLRMLEIIGVNHNDWFMAYFRYKDVPQYVNIYNTSFHGILRQHFICGVFKYIYS